MKSFLNFLEKQYPDIAKSLQGTPGTTTFNNSWKALASSSPDYFNTAQHEFIKSSHYEPAANGIKNALKFDINEYPQAVQDVLWSTSVQHGAGGATRIFRAAGIKPGMSPAEIINRVYAERSKVDKYFPRSSADIKKSVANRFKKERQDALRMLG